jgi:hypothetical protein
MNFLNYYGYNKDFKSDTLPMKLAEPSDCVSINFTFDLEEILQEINAFFEIYNVLNLAQLYKNSQ